MPFVRIDLPRGRSPEQRRAIGDAVYEAMRATINVPENDQFQVITEHDPENLILNPVYLGIQRSKEALAIQVTLNVGRTTEQKKAFFKAIADTLHARVGLRREDIFVNLVEVTKENWSFGNGIAQYAG